MQRIHSLIQSGSFPNCTSLAKTLEVTTKTVYRDIEYMRTDLDLPIAYNGQRFGYYFTEPVVDFPPVPMTDAELFSLLVAHEAMAQYQGTPFRSPMEAALRKLTATLEPGREAGEVSSLFSFRPFAPEKVDEETFRSLTDAVKERLAVRFSYRKVGGAKEEQRTVRPYHLTCIENHWYLIAFDGERKALRTFSLPRIHGLKLTKEHFEVPVNFNAAEYMRGSFGAYRGAADYEVVIEFDAWAADLIRGRQWHASQEITELPNGAIRFRMRVDSLEEVERWVLSWGTHATALRPGALCNRVHEGCVEMSARYLAQLKAEAARPVPNHREMHFSN